MRRLGTLVHVTVTSLSLMILDGCISPAISSPTGVPSVEPTTISPTPAPTPPSSTSEPTSAQAPSPDLSFPTTFQGPMPPGVKAVLGIGHIYSYAVSHDENLLAVLTDTGLMLYRIDPFELLVRNTGISGGYGGQQIEWLPDDTRVVILYPFRVDVFDVPSLKVWRWLNLSDVYGPIQPYFDGWGAIEVSPDGESMAFGSEYGIMVWDMAQDTTTRHDMDWLEDIDYNVQWSGSSDKLVFEPPLTIWDRLSFQMTELMPGTFATMSPNFERATIRDQYGVFGLWDVVEHEQLSRFSSVPKASPDWSLVAGIHSDGIKVVNAQTGEMVAELEIKPSGASNLYWSPDNSVLAVGDTKTLTLWNVVSNQVKASYDKVETLGEEYDQYAYWPIGFSSDSKRLLISRYGQSESIVTMIDIETGTVLHAFHGFASTALEKHVVTRGDGLRIWDAATGKLLHEIVESKASDSFAWSADSTQLAVISDDIFPSEKTTTVWDVQTAAPVIRVQGVNVSSFKYGTRSTPVIGRGESGGFSPDGTRSAIVLRQDPYLVITLNDVESNTHLSEYSVEIGYDTHLFESFEWTPDSRFLGGMINGTYYLWNAQTGDLIKRNNTSFLTSSYREVLAFSPDGTLVAIQSFGIIYILPVP